VPVEEDFSDVIPNGSDCAHWSDSCFGGAELMGSRITAADTDLPISRITVGALEDMGYEVDYSKADPLSASDLSPSCVCSSRGRRELAVDPNVKNTKRELSSEGYEAARQYGLSILNTVSENLTPLPEGVVDKSGEMIYVLYEENDEVHTVIVRSANAQ
jgi:hypothetical protein